MATITIEYMSFLTSFLLFVLISFPVANSIPGRDIDQLCSETTEKAFCVQKLNTDPRITAARDLHDVLIIAIAISKMQVDDGTTHIGTVSKKFNGPIGKRRIAVCKKNYEFATARFHNAWEQGHKRSYHEAGRLVRVGTNAVIHCENAWRKNGPVQQSPLTEYNMNVFKLSGIISLIIQKLAP